MKILSLEAQNLLRLKAVHIEPGEDHVVIIGGENKQGKTSVLNVIRMACGGAKALPARPIHEGAASGSARIDLGDLVVEFEVDAKGGHVIVRGSDGKKKEKPQTILDRLFAKVAFNPQAFADAEPKEQQKILRQLVGLDFSQLDADRAKLYEKRTSVGSVRSDAEVRVSQFATDLHKAPDEEVSIADLVKEKDAADDTNRRIEAVTKRHVDAVNEVERIKDMLSDAEAEERAAFAERSQLPPMFDTEATAKLIAGAEDINRRVRDKKARAKAVATFTARDREYADITKQIAAIDEEKRKQLAEAKWPVPGLGFAEDGSIWYNGQPFEQASQAEARIVSFAIGAALNPDLRVVLIDDGEKLDKSSMRHLAQLAAEKDMQVWVERVGDGDAGAVIIEDGEVANYSDNA